MSKLSEDLVSIRKEARLSKQDVFDKCRVPLETIYAIEDGSIFAGKMRNKTYLRSYIRTYAKAIGISEEDITIALDDHEIGSYEDSLTKKYLSRPEKISDQPKSEAGKKPAKKEHPDSNDQKKPEKGSGKKTQRITPESQEKTKEDIEWEDSVHQKRPSTSTSDFASFESVGTEPASAKMPEPPELDNVDWASKVKDAVYRPQRNRLLWVIIAILLAFALAISSVYWFWIQEEEPVTMGAPSEEVTPATPDAGAGSPESEAGAGTPAMETPSDLPETPTEAAESPEPAVTDTIPSEEEASVLPSITTEEILVQDLSQLGPNDIIHVVIYALHGNLEPIRVQSDVFTTDESALRPYWVEHQEAMRFEFVDEITIQGALGRLVLVINGHVIDDFSQLYHDGPRIRLSRAFIMENPQLHTPPDTPFSGVPEPRAITDRPRFSP